VLNIFKTIGETKLILLTSVFILATHNWQFFHHAAQSYQGHENYWLSLLLVTSLHFLLLFLFLLMLGFGRVLKALLSLVLITSASAAYFTDTYNVIIDMDMLDNVMKTDAAEARDLLSVQQALYIIFLGVIPAWLIWRLPTNQTPLTNLFVWRVVGFVAGGAILAGNVLVASEFYATYIREHANVRYYSTPLGPYAEMILYTEQQLNAGQEGFKIIAPNASRTAGDKPKLMVMVVGETVRAANWGLSGYERNTTPRLSELDVINYTNVMACGTSTAASLPCMFSAQKRTEFDKRSANNQENLLDILHKTGVDIVWFDNNSSSKGVADRVTYINSKSSATNPVCNTECRDEGMIQQSQQWLEGLNADTDKLVLLHQMGSHGPAYYKRYPEQFEAFTDTCLSNQLDSCSQQQIINTYDNTIVYTDHFLAETINWLQEKQDHYQVSMLYISDHGESLGENGLYLHGYPYMLAPIEQKHVPMVYWASEYTNSQQQAKDNKLSHDELFHSVLGWYNVTSQVYKPGLDFLQ
jgi:lipid A ethanolaminephosphotransferase